MTQLTVVSGPGHKIAQTGRASSVLNGFRARWNIWSTRRRARAALLASSDAELKELGISRAQALFFYNNGS